MRWYRDGFCQLEKQKALETGKDAYEFMNEEAAKFQQVLMVCCVPSQML